MSACEALLSGMVLAGLLCNHLWRVAFEEVVRMVVLFGSAFAFRSVALSGELSVRGSSIVLWAGTAVLLVGALDSALLIQYDVALGHLPR